MGAGSSRRDFLAAIAGTGAALVGRPPLCLAADEADPRVAELVAGTIGVDAHCHIDPPMAAAEVPGPDLDLAGEIGRSGLSAICATFAVDRQALGGPGVAYDRFENAMKSMDAQLARTRVERALNFKDLKAARDAGRPVVIQAVEGGHFLEGKLERLAAAYGRGLRVLGLLHDNDASPPLGDIYTKSPQFGGLTEFGARVVEECNRLGILIDLTHADIPTVEAVLKRSTRPVVFSHTALKSAADSGGPGRGMQARLITREHAKTIADAGGVVGVWTHQGNSPAEYVRAIRAMVDAAGIDHVCIGTDARLTPGATRPGGPGGPAQEKAGGPAMKKAGGPGGNGGINKVWGDRKAGFYRLVIAEMLEQGFTGAEIGKVGGGNFCRAFDASTSHPG